MSQDPDFWPEHNTWWTRAVIRLAEGDGTGTFWEEVEDRIRALLRVVAGGRDLTQEEADDLVQEVLLRLCQGRNEGDTHCGVSLLAGLRRASGPAHYLRTAIENLLFNETRRDRRARATRAAERYMEFVGRLREHDPAHEAGRREAARRVRFVVNHVVAREDREVLVLKYFHGLDTGEIARQLRITRAAVLKRLFRARERVRAELSNPTT